ncbi:unnamed protein product [Debaryomyces fabryi]|nr:unnamed protein product [Debaryomyces fabryi]
MTMAENTPKPSENYNKHGGDKTSDKTHDKREEQKLESLSTDMSTSPGKHDGSNSKKHLLSTSSREGIQVASKITPTRLANLLIRKGPLPIRHITSQLSVEVQGFEMLSLSKQRRLIMAAMEQMDPENNVVFEKIGWGQWAVRKVDSDYIVTEGTEKLEEEGEKKQINVHELRNQAGLKLGWSKKQQDKARRESITNRQANLHNLKLPNEPMGDMSAAIELDSESDYALSDIDDGADIDVDDDSDEDDDDDELFTFDQDDDGKFKTFKHTKSPPIKFANRVPLKFSPPPGGASRRKSSSSNNASISKHTQAYPHAHRNIFNRSRLNSIENFDNYILSSAKNSNVSINSPPPPVTTTISSLPLASWNSGYTQNNINASPDGLDSIATAMSGGRKSSFNESHLRSTLSSSLPRNSPHTNSHFHSQSNLHPSSATQSPPANSDSRKPHPNQRQKQNENISDTDEEDWATIGAESLRKSHQNNKDDPDSIDNGHKPTDNDQADERAAAFALVDLMSV